MKQAFALPNTPTSRVTYTQRKFMGNPCVPYATSAVIKTPKSNDDLLMVMLARQVGQSDINGIEGIEPPKEFQRGHPAQHRLTKYASLATACLFLLFVPMPQSIELPASTVEWQNVC